MTEARRLRRFGIWRSANLVTPELAAGIERLGFGTLWLGSSPSGDLAQAEELLDATTTLILATSIVNMWQDQPQDVAGSFARVQRRHPGRFLLGIGAGHREATQQYARPYETLARYVDVLQAGGVPRDSLVLAALGPKVLGLARDRAAGAIPYLVPPGHTRRARAVLGPGPLRAPEHKVVLDTDPTRPARSAGPRCTRISAWSTTPATCAGWAGPAMTSAGAAATRWPTRWPPMAARPGLPRSSPATSTREPTTSASISSPRRAPTRCPGTARWLRRWDCRDQHGADTRCRRAVRQHRKTRSAEVRSAPGQRPDVSHGRQSQPPAMSLRWDSRPAKRP